jgi:hypothetical protein
VPALRHLARSLGLLQLGRCAVICRYAVPLLLVLLAGCRAQQASPDGAGAEYLGMRHPPLPAPVEVLGGTILDPTASMEYDVAHVRDAEGHMFWLERLVHQDEQGLPHWEVVAVQRLPTPDERDEVILGHCRQGEMHEGGDGYTFAVAQFDDGETLTRVHEAWRVDTAESRFVTLPASEVQCINEGYDKYKVYPPPAPGAHLS